MVDVPLHMRRGQQGNRLASDVTYDLAEHNHPVFRDVPFNPAALAHDNLGSGHITLKLTIDLDLILADDLHAFAAILRSQSAPRLARTQRHRTRRPAR